jgi:hypothetical protein
VVIKLTNYQKIQQPAGRSSISDLIPSLIPGLKLNNWPALVPTRYNAQLRLMFFSSRLVLGFKTFYKGSVQVMVKVQGY